MSMFNLAEQLNGSFEELMEEIRAMRRELERVRRALEDQAAAPVKPMKSVRSARAKPPAARTRKHVA